MEGAHHQSICILPPKPVPGSTSRNAGWQLANHLKAAKVTSLGTKEGDKDRFGRVLTIWSGPKKTDNSQLSGEELIQAGERGFVNLVRRFLHMLRESNNIAEDYSSFGFKMPTIGGSNQGADKHITWKDVQIATFRKKNHAEAEYQHELVAIWDDHALQESLGKDEGIRAWNIQEFKDKYVEFIAAELARP